MSLSRLGRLFRVLGVVTFKIARHDTQQGRGAHCQWMTGSSLLQEEPMLPHAFPQRLCNDKYYIHDFQLGHQIWYVETPTSRLYEVNPAAIRFVGPCSNTFISTRVLRAGTFLFRPSGFYRLRYRIASLKYKSRESRWPIPS